MLTLRGYLLHETCRCNRLQTKQFHYGNCIALQLFPQRGKAMGQPRSEGAVLWGNVSAATSGASRRRLLPQCQTPAEASGCSTVGGFGELGFPLPSLPVSPCFRRLLGLRQLPSRCACHRTRLCFAGRQLTYQFGRHRGSPIQPAPAIRRFPQSIAGLSVRTGGALAIVALAVVGAGLQGNGASRWSQPPGVLVRTSLQDDAFYVRRWICCPAGLFAFGGWKFDSLQRRVRPARLADQTHPGSGVDG